MRQLVAAGHEVTGTTRKPENAARVDAAGGATPDGLRRVRPGALDAAVAEAAPEVVITS